MNIAFVYLFAVAAAAKLPTYFTKCERKSDNFSKCLLDNAKNGIKKLANEGDPEWKINNLLPIKVKQINLQATPSLKVILNDAEFYGFDMIEFNDIRLSKDVLNLNAYMEHIILKSQYNVQGQILVLPIQGVGGMNISLSKVDLAYTAKLAEFKNNGKIYYKIDSDKVILKIDQIAYYLDNLFNGNKQLGDQMNFFLNENSLAVFEEVREAITQTVASLFKLYISAYLKNIPIEELIA